MENLIPYIRRKKNIKQRDMARALEVSPSYLCKVERGIQEPSEKLKISCAEYLRIPEQELFPDKTDKRKLQNINNSFKNRLWSFRKEKGIQQKQLAKLIGCSPSYLSKVEKGMQEPNGKFRKKCAKILKIKEIELFPLN